MLLSNKYKIRIGAAVLIILSGCTKLVSVDAPITSVTEANVYSSDATAISVLTGLYSQMSNSYGYFQGISSISLEAGLSADEFTLYSGVSTTDAMYYNYTNSLFSVAGKNTGNTNWDPLYNLIFTCNAAIEGLSASTSLTPSVKQQLLGESKFLRAFYYFYLVNLYGELPLLTTTDYKSNAVLARSSVKTVYDQIISDLKDAQGLLNKNFVDGNLQPYPSGSAERVRPNQWAATALLARAYLFSGDYPNAEIQASSIINNASLFSLTSLNSTFLKNSQEAIWQLQPIISQQNTQDAILFILPSTGPNSINPVYLSQDLLSSFEINDQRSVPGNWIDSISVSGVVYYYPYKYKAGIDGGVTSADGYNEYLMVLRLSEQFLIRAEARAQQTEANSVDDLNTIRNRAGLLDYAGLTDKTSLLAAILHERQVELFSEWGHRWLDLKHSGNIDQIMTPACIKKGGVWHSYQQLYPIPFVETTQDPNLSQNPGY